MADEDLDEMDFWDSYSSENGVQLQERDIAKYINTWIPPFLLVIGTVGNLISALVLRRIYRHILSCCLYLYVIVITDLFVLYIFCGNLWLEHVTGVDIRKLAVVYNNSLCKIYPFISDFVLHLTSWMAVAMAIETTIITIEPQRALRICRLERAQSVILLIIVLLVCINAHCFWSFALVKVDSGSSKMEICTTVNKGNQQSEAFRKTIWPVLFILIADVLPYCVITTCCFVIMITRATRKDKVSALDTLWRSSSLESESTQQFNAVNITIFICYAIFMLPKLVYSVIFFLQYHEDFSVIRYSLTLDSILILADSVCSTWFFIFLSCKIVLFLGTSSRFRSEFIAVLTCKRHRSKDTNVQKPHYSQIPRKPLLQAGQVSCNEAPPLQDQADNVQMYHIDEKQPSQNDSPCHAGTVHSATTALPSDAYTMTSV